MIIRRAEADDALAIAEIATACWRWAYAHILPAEVLSSIDIHARAERGRKRLVGGEVVYVAVENESVVGFASLAEPSHLPGSDLEIVGLYVHPKANRKGTGWALFRTAVAYGLERNRKVLTIHTLKENVVGRAFYEKLGGELAHEDTWTCAGVEYPAVWYRWQLDEVANGRMDELRNGQPTDSSQT